MNAIRGINTVFYRYNSNGSRTSSSLAVDKLLDSKERNYIRVEIGSDTETMREWSINTFHEWHDKAKVCLTLSNVFLSDDSIWDRLVTSLPDMVQIGNEPIRQDLIELYLQRVLTISNLIRKRASQVIIVAPPLGTYRESIRSVNEIELHRLWCQYLGLFGPHHTRFDYISANIYNWHDVPDKDLGSYGLRFGRDTLHAASRLIDLPPIVMETSHLTRGFHYAQNIMGNTPSFGWSIGSGDKYDELKK